MVLVSVAEAKRTYKTKSILQVVRELWLIGTILRLSDKKLYFIRTNFRQG